jgi:uncharacterized protein YcfJ
VKKRISKSILSIATLLVTSGAMAADYTDMALVTQASPHYETVNVPRQQCQTVEQVVPQQRSLTGAIVGGVAGAIIGSQVGRGDGRVAAGAVGAGVGAIVGDRIDNSNNGGTVQPVQQCTTIENYEQVIRGYNVTYQYNGRLFQTVIANPVRAGDSIRVRVDIAPY